MEDIVNKVVRQQTGMQYKISKELLSLKKRNFLEDRWAHKRKAKSRIPKMLYEKMFKLRNANDILRSLYDH